MSSPARRRPREMTAPCGCTGRFIAQVLHLTPCPDGARGACPNYGYALLAAAIRERPVIVAGLN